MGLAVVGEWRPCGGAFRPPKERDFPAGTGLSCRNGTFLQERDFPTGTGLSHAVCRHYSAVRPKNPVRGFFPATILREGDLSPALRRYSACTILLPPEPTVSAGSSSSLPQHLPPKTTTSIRNDPRHVPMTTSVTTTTERSLAPATHVHSNTVAIDPAASAAIPPLSMIKSCGV